MSIQLQTQVTISPSPKKITHDKYLLLLGSCFSEHIAEKLNRYHFNVCSNPTGTLYNPCSIASALSRIISAQPYTREDIFYHQGLYKSWDHHSRFSHPDPDITLQNMNDQLEKACQFYKKLDFLLLTPGTASVFCLLENKRVVANCHKFPQNNFHQTLLTPDLIVNTFSPIFEDLFDSSPSLNIVFSVSPVRYIQESLHKNQVSKSHLITAIYALEKRFSQVCYFPAYEIMMDELRDYRFYNQDMIHPNETAISIIWEKFQKAFLSEKAMSFIKDYTPVLLAREHRILYPEMDSTKAFALSQIKKIELLLSDYPEINFSEDLRYFQSLL
ncbi:MAG: GSCFA domain-containing protein [Fibrobacter sp.]|jgi:hypothetical protein|nr:GSCFA domain-containing protein [Fibrobacter sp.]